MARAPVRNVLSVAGSDPGGGAGIQADLKTFGALGCHGMAAITALTAQNTVAVTAVFLPPASFVAEQIATVFADIEVAAVKIGMLGSAETVQAVADALRPHAMRTDGSRMPIVLDPVLVATSGAVLGGDGVAEAIREHLVPLATLVTPNLAEAARLAGSALPATAEAVERTTEQLRGTGATAWLVKGGHGAGATADDFLLWAEGDRWFSSPRVATANTHGTGCTLSAAVAAFLARGRTLSDAVAAAKNYLDTALAGADRLRVGHGPGPVDHFAVCREAPCARDT